MSTMYKLLLLVSFLVKTAGDEDPQCTESSIGTSSCAFDTDTCGWGDDDGYPGWIYVKPGAPGPFSTVYRTAGDEDKLGGYIYAPSNTTNASTKSQIPTDVMAMCAIFYLATYEESTIEFFLTDLDTDLSNKTVLYTMDTVDTDGQWEQFGMSCCLMRQNTTRMVGIRTTTGSEPVGLDYMTMTRSDRSCDTESEDYCIIISNSTDSPPTGLSPTGGTEVSTPTLAAKTEAVATVTGAADAGSAIETTTIGTSQAEYTIETTSQTHELTDIDSTEHEATTAKTSEPTNADSFTKSTEKETLASEATLYATSLEPNTSAEVTTLPDLNKSEGFDISMGTNTSSTSKETGEPDESLFSTSTTSYFDSTTRIALNTIEVSTIAEAALNVNTTEGTKNKTLDTVVITQTPVEPTKQYQYLGLIFTGAVAVLVLVLVVAGVVVDNIRKRAKYKTFDISRAPRGNDSEMSLNEYSSSFGDSNLSNELSVSDQNRPSPKLALRESVEVQGEAAERGREMPVTSNNAPSERAKDFSLSWREFADGEIPSAVYDEITTDFRCPAKTRDAESDAELFYGSTLLLMLGNDFAFDLDPPGEPEVHTSGYSTFTTGKRRDQDERHLAYENRCAEASPVSQHVDELPPPPWHWN